MVKKGHTLVVPLLLTQTIWCLVSTEKLVRICLVYSLTDHFEILFVSHFLTLRVRPL